MIEYLTSLNTIAVRDPIVDKDMVIIALNGLPLEFESFITMIENLNPIPSFSDLREKRNAPVGGVSQQFSLIRHCDA